MPDLSGKPVLLLSGSNDSMMPAASRDRLAAVLGQAGATVTYKIVPAGHNLTQDDLTLAAQWLVGLEHLK